MHKVAVAGLSQQLIHHGLMLADKNSEVLVKCCPQHAEEEGIRRGRAQALFELMAVRFEKRARKCTISSQALLMCMDGSEVCKETRSLSFVACVGIMSELLCHLVDEGGAQMSQELRWCVRVHSCRHDCADKVAVQYVCRDARRLLAMANTGIPIEAFEGVGERT